MEQAAWQRPPSMLFYEGIYTIIKSQKLQINIS